MDYWSSGRKVVQDVFFKDTIALYRVDFSENDIGEEIEEETLVGNVSCNVEIVANPLSTAEAGSSYPSSLRVSMPKSTVLSTANVYKFKIVQARLALDTDQWWRVTGWTEAQLSTVCQASRGVTV